MNHNSYFTRTLLHWHLTENSRTLPWKEEKDPYKIWLSEIILQQTRAAQGLAYYLKFIDHYPTIQSLANASLEEVMKHWQGLGYYSRCANLYKTAKIISHEMDGVFPNNYQEILKLPGIGPYTAAAIASFAFGESKAVIDGNVYRVLSRYFGIHEPIDDNKSKKIFQELAQSLIDPENPATYNQAIMDFGATVCKPSLPVCSSCPMSTNCYAYQNDAIGMLPIKSKKILKKTRHFHYIILEYKGRIYFQQRTQKDIWQHLYEPYLMETPSENIETFPKWMEKDHLRKLGNKSQILTHQHIKTYWYHYEIKNLQDQPFSNQSYLSKNNLKKVALPKSIFSFMSENNYF